MSTNKDLKCFGSQIVAEAQMRSFSQSEILPVPFSPGLFHFCHNLEGVYGLAFIYNHLAAVNLI